MRLIRTEGSPKISGLLGTGLSLRAALGAKNSSPCEQVLSCKYWACGGIRQMDTFVYSGQSQKRQALRVVAPVLPSFAEKPGGFQYRCFYI